MESFRAQPFLEEDVEQLSSFLERHKLQQLFSDHQVHLGDEGDIDCGPMHRQTLLQFADKVFVEGNGPHWVKLGQLEIQWNLR